MKIKFYINALKWREGNTWSITGSIIPPILLSFREVILIYYFTLHIKSDKTLQN